MISTQEERWKPVIWFAQARGVGRRPIMILAIGWIVAVVAARVGLPPIERHQELTPRPLETFGTLAICIPASLHAAMLKDDLRWLASVSPRSQAGSRLAWLATTTTFGCLAALIWTATLDPRVPRDHAFSVWILVFGSAVVSVTVIRHDLAAVLPLVVTVLFTTPRLIPFDHNVLYNDRRTDLLTVWAMAVVVLGSLAYTAWGDRHPAAVA